MRPERPEDVRVERHLGLANVLVRRYRVGGATGFDIDDLMQEAALGMLRARQTWDPAIASWSTYAAFWIRQNVGRYVQNNGATVRVPVHLQEKRGKRGEPRRAQVSSLDRSTGHRHGTIGSDEGSTFVDMLSYPEPEDGDTRECLPDGTSLESLVAATRELTDNEAHVLRGRASGKTFAAIGVERGLSRERIRQLEMSAIAKIRAAQSLDVEDDISRAHAKYRAGVSRNARRARKRRAA